jgi:hypothetical protein
MRHLCFQDDVASRPPVVVNCFHPLGPRPSNECVSVIIGMDAHKRSATIEVLDDRARVLAVGRYGTDRAGYAERLAGNAEDAGGGLRPDAVLVGVARPGKGALLATAERFLYALDPGRQIC